MKIHLEKQLKKNVRIHIRILHSLFRLCGWNVGFSSMIAMSVCPFCGRQGCPTGAASAGILGVICGFLIQWGVV